MTRGHHGTGAIGEAMGAVSGWVIDDVYLAGDTIWCDEVAEALERHRPRARRGESPMVQRMMAS